MTSFPPGFLWGLATSSYQIEGAVHLDGRGPSIWDTFCRTPGRVREGHTGDVACDHVHRLEEDLDLLAALGVGAYRFSVAWPRVLPDGVTPHPRGLDFYDRLVDGLLARGIQPWLTLYHWDLPQALEDRGGWPWRGTVDAFCRFADLTSRRLGDRVETWLTHNEPWCASMLGYQSGIHAPGRQSWPDALAAAHHLLLSHGAAVPILRANAPGAKVGITLNFTPATPASTDPADVDAARWFDGWFNRWFLDPVLGRGYPEDMLRDYAPHLPDGPTFLQPGDLQTIAAPLDLLGVNYYTRAILRADGAALPREVPDPPPERRTGIGWEIWPDGLHTLLLRLRDAGLPLYITEAGAAWETGPDAHGEVHDARRVAWLDAHLRAARRAMEDGADLRGFFAWSMLDNFEWAEGYTQRFGLVWVDFETQRRIPKQSARWFAACARQNGLIPC